MGLFKAYSTLEIVQMTGKQRCAVLKRLHRLENAGLIEERAGDNGEFYWLVLKIPDKPEPPKIWRESLSITELKEIANKRS